VTFHLALVTASFVLQTGDRLLTLEQGSSGPSPWDPYANKTILLLARNGTVVISYSGLSYIRDIPTDRWLAETIAGPTIDFRGAPAMRFGVWRAKTRYKCDELRLRRPHPIMT
jgi:hypothetical protein